jgi:MFS transporter, NHS family, xanthosine permease
MNRINIQLAIANFLQFFVWGAWLITIANYWFGTMGWGGKEFGAIFGTLGLASLVMPTLAGIITDKYLNAEKLYAIFHLCSGLCIAYMPQVTDPNTFWWVMLLAMIFYMPTISLCNTISYNALLKSNQDVITVFPYIRVLGTVGFIVAMWATNLTGNKATANQFYISAIMSLVLAIYSFTLPKCPPANNVSNEASTLEKLGLNALGLFKNKRILIFFVFSMFLGGALQLTNMYGDVYISEFAKMPEYANSLVVRYSTIVMSISQISETLFILAIPFFLNKFGIKKVMLISMIAWVLRFGLFAYGNPGSGLWMIIMSCIVYGMAFDFFNISGSLFIETNTDSKIRSSAQGLFMLMTNGLGAIFGSMASGWMIDKYFDHAGVKDWQNIWLAFAGYALLIAIVFAVVFKDDKKIINANAITH